MKIAFYHELHKGGARRGTNEFAIQLKKLGHTVDLYTIEKQDEENVFYTNIYFYKFENKIWKGKNWRIRLYKDTIELFLLLLLNKKISEDINNKKYDACYITASQFIESPFLLNFIKTKKYYYLNDPYYRMIYEKKLFNPERSDLIRNLYERINKYIRKRIDINNIGKADYIIAASIFTQKQFYKVYKLKSEIAYYGVNSLFFHKGKKERDIDILFIGSKDVLDGYPFFNKIINTYNKSNLKVKTVLFENEWLNDKELRDIYRRTKILIACSYNEPLGLVPLEAMACGVVTLAVDEGGYPETVIDGVTGYIIHRDYRKFVEKINLLLNDENLIKTISSNSIKEVKKKWSWKIRGSELEKIISHN
jgi:glycosyltransferase involved in cell wall biosynthesis